MLRMVPLPRSVSLRGGGRTVVIARSQRVRPEVAGPMTSSATKQSKASPHSWIASLALAMTTRKILPATRPRPSFANHEAKGRSDGQSEASRSKLFRRPSYEGSSFRLASGSHDPEKWCSVFGSRSCAKKEAERRQTHVSILRIFWMRRVLNGARRLSAFHRGSRQGAFASFAQLQARLPGTRQDARSCKPAPTGGRRSCVSKRALPAPACPSPGKAPPGPVVMPVSMMPKAARERTANPRAGTALAPCSGVPREHVPSVSEILGNVTGMVTRVKCDVLNYRLDIYRIGLTSRQTFAFSTTYAQS
jgi:hypothetical protein